MAFKRKQRLTLPLFSLAHNPQIAVHITGEIYPEKMPGLSRNTDEMVRLLPVVDLETGEEGLLLVLTVLESALKRIPDGYVGKCVEIDNHGAREGKSYANVDIYLLECPDADEAAPADAAATA